MQLRPTRYHLLCAKQRREQRRREKQQQYLSLSSTTTRQGSAAPGKSKDSKQGSLSATSTPRRSNTTAKPFEIGPQRAPPQSKSAQTAGISLEKASAERSTLRSRSQGTLLRWLEQQRAAHQSQIKAKLLQPLMRVSEGATGTSGSESTTNNGDQEKAFTKTVGRPISKPPRGGLEEHAGHFLAETRHHTDVSKPNNSFAEPGRPTARLCSPNDETVSAAAQLCPSLAEQASPRSTPKGILADTFPEPRRGELTVETQPRNADVEVAQLKGAVRVAEGLATSLQAQPQNQGLLKKVLHPQGQGKLLYLAHSARGSVSRCENDLRATQKLVQQLLLKHRQQTHLECIQRLVAKSGECDRRLGNQALSGSLTARELQNPKRGLAEMKCYQQPAGRMLQSLLSPRCSVDVSCLRSLNVEAPGPCSGLPAPPSHPASAEPKAAQNAAAQASASSPAAADPFLQFRSEYSGGAKCVSPAEERQLTERTHSKEGFLPSDRLSNFAASKSFGGSHEGCLVMKAPPTSRTEKKIRAIGRLAGYEPVSGQTSCVNSQSVSAGTEIRKNRLQDFCGASKVTQFLERRHNRPPSVPQSTASLATRRSLTSGQHASLVYRLADAGYGPSAFPVICRRAAASAHYGSATQAGGAAGKVRPPMLPLSLLPPSDITESGQGAPARCSYITRKRAGSRLKAASSSASAEGQMARGSMTARPGLSRMGMANVGKGPSLGSRPKLTGAGAAGEAMNCRCAGAKSLTFKALATARPGSETDATSLPQMPLAAPGTRSSCSAQAAPRSKPGAIVALMLAAHLSNAVTHARNVQKSLCAFHAGKNEPVKGSKKAEPPMRTPVAELSQKQTSKVSTKESRLPSKGPRTATRTPSTMRSVAAGKPLGDGPAFQSALAVRLQGRHVPAYRTDLERRGKNIRDCKKAFGGSDANSRASASTAASLAPKVAQPLSASSRRSALYSRLSGCAAPPPFCSSGSHIQLFRGKSNTCEEHGTYGGSSSARDERERVLETPKKRRMPGSARSKLLAT